MADSEPQTKRAKVEGHEHKTESESTGLNGNDPDKAKLEAVVQRVCSALKDSKKTVRALEILQKAVAASLTPSTYNIFKPALLAAHDALPWSAMPDVLRQGQPGNTLDDKHQLNADQATSSSEKAALSSSSAVQRSAVTGKAKAPTKEELQYRQELRLAVIDVFRAANDALSQAAVSQDNSEVAYAFQTLCLTGLYAQQLFTDDAFIFNRAAKPINDAISALDDGASAAPSKELYEQRQRAILTAFSVMLTCIGSIFAKSSIHATHKLLTTRRPLFAPDLRDRLDYFTDLLTDSEAAAKLGAVKSSANKRTAQPSWTM